MGDSAINASLSNINYGENEKKKYPVYGFLDINLNFRMIKKNGVYKYNNTHIIVDFSIINRTYETQTNSWRLFFYLGLPITPFFLLPI